MKLPAFGKSLLAARQQDRHPAVIQVIYGDDWTPARDDVPLLAVKPEQFAPGQFDWRCVAGVPVELHHRAPMPKDWDRAAIGFLAGELAEWSPAVNVFFSDSGVEVVAGFAFACRVNGRWPAWWSARLDHEYGERQRTYFTELSRAAATV